MCEWYDTEANSFHISQDALLCECQSYCFCTCAVTCQVWCTGVSQVSVYSLVTLLLETWWRTERERDVEWGLNEIMGIRLSASEQSLCKWVTAGLLQEEYQWSNYFYTTGRCLSPRSLSHTHTHTQRRRELIKRMSGRKSFPEGRRHLNTAKRLLGLLQEPTAQIKWLRRKEKNKCQRVLTPLQFFSIALAQFSNYHFFPEAISSDLWTISFLFTVRL